MVFVAFDFGRDISSPAYPMYSLMLSYTGNERYIYTIDYRKGTHREPHTSWQYLDDRSTISDIVKEDVPPEIRKAFGVLEEELMRWAVYNVKPSVMQGFVDTDVIDELPVITQDLTVDELRFCADKDRPKYHLDHSDNIRRHGKTLYRIVANYDFSDVKRGEKGGFVEYVRNLSYSGDCWIYDDAIAMDDAVVSDDARVSGSSKVSGTARVYGGALVTDSARVIDNARVSGSSRIWDYAAVVGNAEVSGDVLIEDDAVVGENARVYDDAHVEDFAVVIGHAHVCGDANVGGNITLSGNAYVDRGIHMPHESEGDRTVFDERRFPRPPPVATDIDVDELMFASGYNVEYNMYCILSRNEEHLIYKIGFNRGGLHDYDWWFYRYNRDTGDESWHHENAEDLGSTSCQIEKKDVPLVILKAYEIVKPRLIQWIETDEDPEEESGTVYVTIDPPVATDIDAKDLMFSSDTEMFWDLFRDSDDNYHWGYLLISDESTFTGVGWEARFLYDEDDGVFGFVSWTYIDESDEFIDGLDDEDDAITDAARFVRDAMTEDVRKSLTLPNWDGMTSGSIIYSASPPVATDIDAEDLLFEGMPSRCVISYDYNSVECQGATAYRVLLQTVEPESSSSWIRERIMFYDEVNDPHETWTRHWNVDGSPRYKEVEDVDVPGNILSAWQRLIPDFISWSDGLSKPEAMDGVVIVYRDERPIRDFHKELRTVYEQMIDDPPMYPVREILSNLWKNFKDDVKRCAYIMHTTLDTVARSRGDYDEGYRYGPDTRQSATVHGIKFLQISTNIKKYQEDFEVHDTDDLMWGCDTAHPSQQVTSTEIIEMEHEYQAAVAASRRCPSGSIWRRGFTKSDGTRVRGTCVKKKTPSSLKWSPKVKKGALHGWSTSMPARKRREILEKVIRKDGYATVIRRLNWLRNVTASKPTKAAALADMKYLQRRHHRYHAFDTEVTDPVDNLREYAVPLTFTAILCVALFLSIPHMKGDLTID